jgi:sugar (pentulose or hexulose) kinase
MILLPYFNGERTPNLPDATGQLTGMVEANLTPTRLVRAAVDGVAAGLAYCVEALARMGQRAPAITLVGGGAMNRTWQQAIADATGLPVQVREGQEHAARGAGIQAAALVLRIPINELAVKWRPPVVVEVEPRLELRERFALDQRRALIEHMRKSHTGASRTLRRELP